MTSTNFTYVTLTFTQLLTVLMTFDLMLEQKKLEKIPYIAIPVAYYVRILVYQNQTKI